MDYSTRVALGVKDCHLELDEKHFAEPIEDQSDRIVIHFIQSYSLHCPRLKMALKQSTLLDHRFTINQRFGQ